MAEKMAKPASHLCIKYPNIHSGHAFVSKAAANLPSVPICCMERVLQLALKFAEAAQYYRNITDRLCMHTCGRVWELCENRPSDGCDNIPDW